MTDVDREGLRGPVLPGAGASDYERYLRTDELLSLQKPARDRNHHDELLFTVVHQTSELWLKLAGTEVDAAAEHVEHDEVAPALRLLRRATAAVGYITDQLGMLGQMSPWDYHEVRVMLGHGSGFDSPGFRRVATVTQRMSKAFDGLLARRGVELTEVYRARGEHEDLYALAEVLTDWDECVSIWRSRHYLAVARALGEDTIGIQGVPVQALTKLVTQRQLPRLWEARSRLVEIFDAERAAAQPSP
jgi:tryptophan 2,3-dioxygenase